MYIYIYVLYVYIYVFIMYPLHNAQWQARSRHPRSIFHALVNGIKASGDHATQDQPPLGLARREQGTTCVSFCWQKVLSFIVYKMDWIPLKEHLMFILTSAIWQLQAICVSPFVGSSWKVLTPSDISPRSWPPTFLCSQVFPATGAEA